MRKIFIVLTLLVLCLPTLKLPIAHADMECSLTEKNMFILADTRQIYQDGQLYLSQVKHEVKDGVTYIPLRSFADKFAFTLTYDVDSKQTVMKNGEHTFRFKNESSFFTLDNEQIKYRSGETYTEKGITMVPLRDIAKAIGVMTHVNKGDNRIKLLWMEETCTEVDREPVKPTKSVGEVYPINRDVVLEFPVIKLPNEFSGEKLVRSNSPETIVREGIHYIDEISGKVRFIIHKQNGMPEPVKIYLVAQNNNDRPVHVQLSSYGVGGPNQYVSSVGRDAIEKYMTSVKENWAAFTKTLQPGEAAIVIPEMSEKSLKQGQTMTVYADLFSNANVEYKIVALFEDTDLFSTLPFLKGDYARQDGKHIRGTFPHNAKTITIEEFVGDKPARIVIGDGKEDTYVVGVDKISNSEEKNIGNYGVFYDITLERVAPNSIIALNPRGGQYAGAFLVNDKVILAPSAGVMDGPNEQLILHKTGIYPDTVNIKFIPASGSNLPLSILLMPEEE